MDLPDALLRQIDESRAIVRSGYPWWMRPFLLRNVVAITLGRRIYLAPHADDVAALLRHELVHVRQMGRHGVTRFVLKYAAEYVRNRRRGMSHHDAYLAISFEVEAFAAEHTEPL